MQEKYQQCVIYFSWFKMRAPAFSAVLFNNRRTPRHRSVVFIGIIVQTGMRISASTDRLQSMLFLFFTVFLCISAFPAVNNSGQEKNLFPEALVCIFTLELSTVSSNTQWSEHGGNNED